MLNVILMNTLYFVLVLSIDDNFRDTFILFKESVKINTYIKIDI